MYINYEMKHKVETGLHREFLPFGLCNYKHFSGVGCRDVYVHVIVT